MPCVLQHMESTKFPLWHPSGQIDVTIRREQDAVMLTPEERGVCERVHTLRVRRRYPRAKREEQPVSAPGLPIVGPGCATGRLASVVRRPGDVHDGGRTGAVTSTGPLCSTCATTARTFARPGHRPSSTG